MGCSPAQAISAGIEVKIKAISVMAATTLLVMRKSLFGFKHTGEGGKKKDHIAACIDASGLYGPVMIVRLALSDLAFDI
jgi:hypothetical protein